MGFQRILVWRIWCPCWLDSVRGSICKCGIGSLGGLCATSENVGLKAGYLLRMCFFQESLSELAEMGRAEFARWNRCSLQWTSEVEKGSS